MSAADRIEGWIDFFAESPRRVSVTLRRRGARLPTSFQAARFVFFGAVAFWGACLLCQYWRPFDPRRVGTPIFTFIMTIAPFGFLAMVHHCMARGYRPLLGFNWVAPLNLLGVWLAGPLGATAINSLAGAGFYAGRGWVGMEVILQTLAFPISTFVMARPAGALPGLLLATLYLVVVTALDWPRKRRWPAM